MWLGKLYYGLCVRHIIIINDETKKYNNTHKTLVGNYFFHYYFDTVAIKTVSGEV